MPRVRCALAESYERIDKIEEAIKCYLRAEGNRDREGIALRYSTLLCASWDTCAKRLDSRYLTCSIRVFLLCPPSVFSSKLAKLHAQLPGAANRDKAAEYYRRMLARDEETRASLASSSSSSSSSGSGSGGGGVASAEAIAARVFLAHHGRDCGRFDEAAAHCARLMEAGGATRDAAHVLLSELKQMQAAAAAASGGR
jgi:hypothetical protein